MSGSMSAVSDSVGRLDLLVVELGDLVQHRVEGAGVLAHGHHLHDHGREDRVLRQRAGERLAAAHGLLDVADGRAATTLPVVSATMSRLCRIGTPDLSIVPRLRAKRASAILRKRLPKTGSLSFSRVDDVADLVAAGACGCQATAPPMPPSRSSGALVLSSPDSRTSTRVGSGQRAAEVGEHRRRRPGR